MNELKKCVFEEFDEMIQEVVKCLREAEKKEEGLDLTELFGKQSQHNLNLNIAFDKANERIKQPKKKGFF